MPASSQRLTSGRDICIVMRHIMPAPPQALRPEFPGALGRMTGLLRLTLDVASFAPAAGGALPAALSRMTALQSLQLLGDWRHTVHISAPMADALTPHPSTDKTQLREQPFMPAALSVACVRSI